MRKAKIIKNGNVNLSNLEVKQVEQVAKKINNNLTNVIIKTDALIDKLKEKPNFDKYYSDIEAAIIEWNLDGTKTAGVLTRKIIKILDKKK